jgi:hypothetical protein
MLVRQRRGELASDVALLFLTLIAAHRPTCSAIHVDQSSFPLSRFGHSRWSGCVSPAQAGIHPWATRQPGNLAPRDLVLAASSEIRLA